MSGYAFHLVSKADSAASGWLTRRANRAIVEDGDCLFARDMQTDKIDWKIVRKWLDRCNSEHGDVCVASQSIALPGFQVLDCNTRRIVSAPRDCKYVTLSYVWGAQSPHVLGLEQNAALPALIEDAIICTQAMGFGYLWIDRYCIDQNTESKHALIQNMDRIYLGASVTIINATGESSHFGLPGISQPRLPLRSVSINGLDIVMIPNTKAEIGNSKWCTRGWTYQESILSHRRLVFTPSQLYFQCLEAHCCELIPAYFPSAPAHINTLGQSILAFSRENQEFIPNQSIIRIREYLRRELSYDSDILSAIMGILRRTCHHLWGLPFEPFFQRHSLVSEGKTRFSEPGFLAALLWTPEIDSMKPKLKRRTGFPSWSWVGWQGIAGLDPGSYDLYEDEVDLSLEINDRSRNRMLSIETYALEMIRPHADMYQFEPCLYITGWVTKVRFQRPDWLQRFDGLHFALGNTIFMDAMDASCATRIGTATIMTSLLVSDDNKEDTCSSLDQLFDESWVVLLFARKTGISEAHGLILRPCGHNVYERLGVIHGSVKLARDVECDDAEGASRESLHFSILEGETESLSSAVLGSVDGKVEDTALFPKGKIPLEFYEGTEEVGNVSADVTLSATRRVECEKRSIRLI